MTQMSHNKSSTATLPTLAAPADSRSFWDIVGAAFRRRRVNLVATGFIAFLAALAVLVPFLASSHPYTIELMQQDGSWQRSYPLFANLTQLDLILLICGGAVVVYAIIHHLLKRKTDREERFASRLSWMGVLIVLAIVGSVLVALFRTNPISPADYRTYQALEQRGAARNGIYPPIPWGYATQEPLLADRVYEFPSREHPLGLDGIGRDALARLLWSTRVVMGIGFIAETIGLFIGIVVGSILGYFARGVDLIGMRLVEIFESIPTFFLILIFVALYGRNIFMIMVILGLTGWTGIARFVRAEFLRLRQLDYVHAAVATGLPLRRILFRHMLPNGLTPVIVTLTFGIAGAVMSESGLSFLGVGVEPPTPSWGSMLNEAGNPAETFRWWLAIAPGLMIFLTVFAYNIIGEGARDAIDPRINKMG